MPVPADCPGIETWSALDDITVSRESLEQWERHLESCPLCQEHLDQSERCGDELMNLWRKFGDPTAAPPDPTLCEVLERLHDGKSLERTRAADPADLFFLRPAGRPDILGTLGEYEVQEVIGAGGMGVVLKAFDPALHRMVAIKVLAAAVAGSATARRRFTREAQAAAAVCHENVVTVHGVHEVDGLPYLVMQYIEGESLQERLDRAGPLDLVEIVQIAHQTAAGLAVAHAQGLIHRDIKPANILIADCSDQSAIRNPQSAIVKLTDFGLARMIDDVGLTQNGVVAGTPEYMSPEQARGETVDYRSDLFSLGSVLYAMSTGGPPFGDSSALAVLRQVSEQQPVPIRSLSPNVPVWLESLIARLMAKNPTYRFQTAAEVAALLQGYLAHLEQSATVPAPALPAFPSSQSGRRAGVLGFASRRWYILLALVLPACLAVTALLLQQRAEEDPAEKTRKVLARLEKLGAQIQHDESRPDRPVTGIGFKDTPPESMPSPDCCVWKITDANLQDLAVFPRLRRLDFTDARKITDAALRNLVPPDQLQELFLGRTPVTDAGMKDIAAFKQLRALGLEETAVTDAGVREIADLTELVYLNLGGTKITHAGLKELAGLKKLRMLCLYDTAITDAGLKELRPFTRLQKLLIGNTAVTDAGLKELVVLKQLRTVDRTTSSSAEIHSGKPRPTDASEPQQAGSPSSGGRRGWLAAAGILGFVLAVSLAGVWWFVRHNRHAAQAQGAPAFSSLAVQCSACGQKLRAPANLAGKKVRCPKCAQSIQIPESAGGSQGITSARTPATQRGWLPALACLPIFALGVGLLALGLLRADDEANEQARVAIDSPASDIDERVLALAFTPDDKKLVTAGARHVQPGQFMVWDVPTTRELVRVRGMTGIRSVAMSPDGKTVACGVFGGPLTLRDIATGQPRTEAIGHEMGVNSLAFSPDGTRIITAGLDRVLKLWNVQNLNEIKEFRGHTDMIYSVAFFSDGKRFVSGGQDRSGRIWDISSDKARFILLGHGAPIETVAVSPNDAIVATASWDRTIRFWNPATGDQLAMLQGHDSNVLGMTFSADGKFLASSTQRGTVYFWDVQTRQQIWSAQEHTAPVWSLAFSSDGKRLASGSSDKSARLWDPAAGRVVATLSTVGNSSPASADIAPNVSAQRGLFIAAGLIVSLAALSLFGAWLVLGRRIVVNHAYR
jgi:serine/threonine protein kinase